MTGAISLSLAQLAFLQTIVYGVFLAVLFSLSLFFLFSIFPEAWASLLLEKSQWGKSSANHVCYEKHLERINVGCIMEAI